MVGDSRWLHRRKAAALHHFRHRCYRWRQRSRRIFVKAEYTAGGSSVRFVIVCPTAASGPDQKLAGPVVLPGAIRHSLVHRVVEHCAAAGTSGDSSSKPRGSCL